MWALIESELRRFRGLAIALALGHLGVLGAAAAFDALFVFSPLWLVAVVAYALASLFFGLYQIGSWRRGDLWIHLLHRPLASGRIFLALTSASAIFVLVVVALPIFVVIGIAGALDPQGVDPRHYQLPPFAAGCALAFYLVGCLLALAPRGRRAAAIASAVLTALFLVPGTPWAASTLGPLVFVPLLLVLGWLGWLAASAFGPDLAAPPRRSFAVAALALPAQYVLFLALSFGVLVGYSLIVAISEAGLGFARFGWNDYYPAGSYPRATYLDGTAAMEHGLRLGGTARSRALAAKVATSTVVEVVPAIRAFPVRHEPMLMDLAAGFDDRLSHRRWTFRHDAMLYAGRSLRTGQPAGWLGAGGVSSEAGEAALRPFAEVPLAIGARYVLTGQRLYCFDGAHRRVKLRWELPSGERFVALPFEADDFDLALSDRALYLFAVHSLLGDGATPVPLVAVDLPGEASNLERAFAVPVEEGWLVSFLFGTRSERDLRPARQVVVLVGQGGGREVLTDRVLTAGLPAGVRHRGFLVSPLLQTVEDLVRSALLGPGRLPGDYATSLRELLAHPPPRRIVAWAAALAAFAAAATFFAARRRGLAGPRRLAWTVAALFVGIPALLTFFLVTTPPDG